MDGVRQSEGLAIFWKKDLSLSIQTFSHRDINGLLIFEKNTKWMLTCLNGYPVTDLRMLGYNILRALKDLNP